MSAPFDRPANGEPGGCECFTCGVIFIGAEWHTECAVCHAKAMEARQGGNGEAGAVHDSAVPDRGFAQPTGSIKGGDRG